MLWYLNEHTTIPVVGVVLVVEEGTGVAVDGSGMDCVTAIWERHWCDFFHYFEHTFIHKIYTLHIMYMFLIIAMVKICHLNCIISIIDMMSTWT